MITQELIQYIKTQIQSGQTKDVIKSNLITKGWQASDIESVFQTITSNPPSSTSSSGISNSNQTTKGFPPTLAVILVICLVLAAGGIFVFSSFLKNKSTSNKNLVNNSANLSPSFTPSASPTINQNNSEDTIIYSSPEQGYGFRYLKSWKIDKQGTLTALAAPDNANFQICAAIVEKLLACDIAVSTIPYVTQPSLAPGVTLSGSQPSKTYDEQTKDLATQLSVGNGLSPVTVNNRSGYEMTSTTPGGSSFNILLQGSKNMILAQFINMKTRQDLSKDQLMVLNSIIEQ